MERTRGRPSYAKSQAVKRLQANVRRKQAQKRYSSVPKRASAINKNRLAIKRLKNKETGGVFQRNFQLARLAQAPDFVFGKDQPLAFALNDFTSSTATNLAGGLLFTPTYTPVGAGNDLTANIIGNWRTENPGQINGLNPKYQQWSDQNDATVSPIQYMPLSAKYVLNFSRPTQDSAQPSVNLRVDVITTRRRYLKSDFHDYTMPGCLGAFAKMAISNEEGKRNQYNPALWSVRTKYLKLPAISTGVNVIRQNQSRNLVLNEYFKPRNIKLHLDTVSPTQKEPFHLAVDPDIIRWCIVSCGDNPVSGANAGIVLKLQRTIKYRDLDNKPL